jgi:2-polyprenyl-3-methyl-5-hydroxy-6-metoxy-1,4-benzoquinol methylase
VKEQQWLEDGWFFHNHAWHLLHEHLRLIREVPGAVNLLDYGAGTGLAAAVIQAVFPNLHVQVYDVESECYDFWAARELIAWTKQEYMINGIFDLVLCSHVIEHIEDPRDTIKKMFNLCNKRLMIAVPDGDVHFYDHKVIYDREKFKNMIFSALEGCDFKFKHFPIYHQHFNNLVAVIDK